jgi:cytochrome c-type biogenesis protein CcmF
VRVCGGGGRAPGSVVRLVARNRRRYGGYLVHVAVLLFAIGVAGSSAYQTVREEVLSPGQSMRVADYTLTYRGVQNVEGANYRGFRALVDVSRGGDRVATVTPGMNNYPIEGPANEASLYHDPRTLGDVFTTAQLTKGGTSVDLKVFSKPLVNLIWAAGFLFVFGALVALWPDAVEQRRLDERYAPAAA